ncbi:transcriptional regulator with XRE-family HTH domain [Paenibacillus shirakamiensis]|uniref:Transcriptional regulator with XRE-family HTH domain n=1 Tax=Paenibacillus shirakamiensis TaxID=1265935 RepID=A0ABS4JHI3_9BACL|nr:helix-turn-helix transcriptional regulator [Paenibacillus shirakamiensis]MBP2000566.1 transcriptional regulator with XRE-family HTH domain [Paenibacillus shirakamiensis]
MQSIYDRIELLIQAKGMTKKKFCSELSISTGNLGDWKRGKSTPSTNKLIEISIYFDISLDWLMTGRERNLVSVKESLEPYLTDQPNAKGSLELSLDEEKFIQEYLAFTRYRKIKDDDLH